jgi:hypothetical protein
LEASRLSMRANKSGRHIDFDDFDRPVKITMGSVTTYFRYAPDGSRYLQQTTTSSGSAAVTKTVYYLGKYYERVDWSDGKTTEEHTYIGPSIAVYQTGFKRDVRYLHLDRLGSVEAVTNTLGAEVTGDMPTASIPSASRGRATGRCRTSCTRTETSGRRLSAASPATSTWTTPTSST